MDDATIAKALEALAEAILTQAEAIDRLAESNEALVNTISGSLADEERPVDTYLDGSPQ